MTVPLGRRERLYYRDAADRMLARPLDGLTLFYHRPSGITHMVDSPVPEILSTLTEEPLAAEAILDRLSRDYDLDGEGDALGLLTGHLEALCDLGLVRIRGAEAELRE